MARRVTPDSISARGPAIVAGLAAEFSSLAAAARAVGVSRGTLDGILSGHQTMGRQTAERLGAYLESQPQALRQQIATIGRLLSSDARGRPSELRKQIREIRRQDNATVLSRIRRLRDADRELSGYRRPVRLRTGDRPPRDTDREWYAEYGAQVERISAWWGDGPRLAEPRL